MTTVKPVRFPDAELEVALAAAAKAGLKFNAWVRRACREQADLERAIAAQDAESKVGLERDGGVDWPLGSAAADRPFTPDFGKRLKP
jgi:hypothetical protein